MAKSTPITEDLPASPPMTVERYWELMRGRLIRQGYQGEALEHRLQAIKTHGTSFQFDKGEILDQ